MGCANQYILVGLHHELYMCSYFLYLLILFEFSVFRVLSNIQGGRVRFAASELHFCAGGFIPGKY